MKKPITIFLSVLMLFIFSSFGEDDCSKLVKYENDPYNGNQIWSTKYENIYFTKIVLGDTAYIDDTSFFMGLKAYGYTLENAKGVYIILADKTVLKFPDAEIEYDVNKYDGPDWIYSASLRLEPDDIEKIKASSIVSYKLYIYEEVVKPKQSAKYLSAFNCLLLSKGE